LVYFWLSFGGQRSQKVSVPRKIRVEYLGAIYHVMSRGDRPEHIVLDDVDHHDFLKTLAETCRETIIQGKCAKGLRKFGRSGFWGRS
jgi:hypothetical protein